MDNPHFKAIFERLVFIQYLRAFDFKTAMPYLQYPLPLFQVPAGIPRYGYFHLKRTMFFSDCVQNLFIIHGHSVLGYPDKK